MKSLSLNRKLVIGMVGLPARGKTYYATKINRYLKWIGVNSRYISLDEYLKSADLKDSEIIYSKNDQETNEIRDQLECLALEDTLSFLESGGEVVIYDTFTFTKERRMRIKDMMNTSLADPQILWIECQSNDNNLIKLILSQDLKLSKNLCNASEEKGLEFYHRRLENLLKLYEELSEDEYKGIHFVKLHNLNQEVTIFNVTGYLSSRLLSFILNLRVRPQPIYLIMHGETKATKFKKAGLDPELTISAENYAKAMGEHLSKEFKDGERPMIFSSSLKRSMRTAHSLGINGEHVSIKTLDDIDYGQMEGASQIEIGTYLMKSENPLATRFPQGESYLDLIERLEPLIIEIERTEGPIVVVGHRSVLRCVYSFFTLNDFNKTLPFIDIPFNSVIKLIPELHSCSETWLKIDSDGSLISREFAALQDKPKISRKSRFNSIGPI